MAFYSYLSTKIIIAFITKSYKDLFGVRSYINALFFQVVSMIWMSYLWIPQWKQQTKLIPMRKATLKDFIKYTQFGRYPDKTAAAVQIFQALMQEILHYYAVGGLYKNSQPMK